MLRSNDIYIIEHICTLILAESLYCSTVEQRLKEEFAVLSNLPYESMKNLLFARGVITRHEKVVIDNMVGTEKMAKVLDIVMISLKLKQTSKYESFLEAMEESDDMSLKEASVRLKILSEWISNFQYYYFGTYVL